MKALLTKIAIRKAVGLYLGEHEVAVCRAVATPLGPVITSSACEPCTPENLAEVIERLLVPLLGPKRRVPVAVGLASSRVFFSTRLISTGGIITPESLLQKSLLSSNISIDDLTADMLRGTVNKMPIAHIAACRTKYMTGVVGILSKLGVRPYRAEPAPCALIRLADQQYRAPRRSKTVLRIFLGAHHGMAVLVAGGQPLTWKTFMLSPGMESFNILSITRGLVTQQKHFGVDVDLDYVIIHGRLELHERLQQEQLPSEIGTRVIWHAEPALDGVTHAYGLALGCLMQELKAFDLSRHLKARAPIMEIFPWGELGFAAAMMGIVAAVLVSQSMKLSRTYMSLKTANSQHVCLVGQNDARALEKDQKELEKKVQAMRSFIEGRIPWTTYMYELSKELPAKAELTSFIGKNSLTGSKKKGASDFEIEGKSPLQADGSIPSDVDEYLTKLSKNPLWLKNFATVTTDIKLPLTAKDARNDVDFTISCVAKSKDSGKSGKAGSAKSKK
jgi:hypothetical protein